MNIKRDDERNIEENLNLEENLEENLELEEKTRKFICMYIYKDLPRHDTVKLGQDQGFQLLSLLYKGKVVHTERIIPGHVTKCDIHIDYMVIDAKNMRDAKGKFIKGCNFHIVSYLVEDANNIKKLLRI